MRAAHTGGKTVQSLIGEGGQALPKRKGKHRERYAIDERVPAESFFGFNRMKVTLHEPMIAKRSQPREMQLADVLAGGGKLLEARLCGQALVESDQFAALVATGEAIRLKDRGQFERK